MGEQRAEDLHIYTKGGKMPRVLYSEICQWIKEAWDAVSDKTIVNSFKKAKIIDINFLDDDDYKSPASNNDVNDLLEELLQLFNSDSETSDFDGFQ